MRTIQDMVSQEVLCCMSAMVSALTKGYGAEIRSGYAPNDRDLSEMIEQAFELASPVADYEEAAIQAGWTYDGAGTFAINPDDEEMRDTFGGTDWADLCAMFEIEPYDREVFEHWAVTDWFADQLIAHGEKVDKDFAGLCVWARTTTGQAIYADYVIEQIYAATHKAD